MRRSRQLAMLELYQPDLIPLSSNLTAAVFPLMKIFPADFCVRRAFAEGVLGPGSHIIETSSGAMALALAIVCAWGGLRLTIVADSTCDAGLRRRIEDLGATVHVVHTSAMSAGARQAARLNRVQDLCASDRSYWWVNQCHNPAIPAAYSTVAATLLDSIGRIDCLVGSVGSGGSVCGIAHYLRLLYPDLNVVGVDTCGSVLFGQGDAPGTLRGFRDSLRPGNLDHTAFDEVHWLSTAEAFSATRLLHRQTTLFRGPSSGAAWIVARYLAARNPQMQVLCLSPDNGVRYAGTVYDDRYLLANNLKVDRLPTEPRRLGHPDEAAANWSCIAWARRSYGEVTNPVNRTISECAIG